MPLPNLLATRKGRIAAFFLMYLTEGLPVGFAMTAVATQLRRTGAGPAEIGGFLALALLPWAFKWLYGPFVDLIASPRLGPRRGWILGAQALMVLTLLPLAVLTPSAQFGPFLVLLFLHNLSGAVQDVAVDALAVTTLHEDERAFASGMMFGGQSLGVLLGGGGTLLLVGQIGLAGAVGIMALVILAVMTGVVLPMRELVPEATAVVRGWGAVAGEVAGFLRQALQALFGSRLAWAGLLFAVLPISAMALARGLQSNLAVDLGLSNEQIGGLPRPRRPPRPSPASWVAGCLTVCRCGGPGHLHGAAEPAGAGTDAGPAAAGLGAGAGGPARPGHGLHGRRAGLQRAFRLHLRCTGRGVHRHHPA